MAIVFMTIVGLIVAINAFRAHASKSEAAMFVALMLGFDFVASWFIQITTQPPIRPVCYMAVSLFIIWRYVAKISKFKDYPIARFMFPAGYMTMILINLGYLSTRGFSNLVYYVMIDTVFLCLVGTNLVMSQRHGAVDAVLSGGLRNVLHRSVADLERK